MDRHAHAIGKIVDVFGPVKAPYVAIRPFKSKSGASVAGKFQVGDVSQITPDSILYVSDRPDKHEKARKRRR